jgi:predicted acylesterase/phospholipase RssA
MSGAGADPVRILSLDGGPGTFFSIRVLVEMERRNPGFIETIDIFAGTSSGGMAALYLAKHLGEPGAVPLKVLEDCQTFVDGYARSMGVPELGWRALLWPSRPLTEGRAYQRFRRTLDQAFGTASLRDLRRKVLIMSFDSQNWAPFAFRNFWGTDKAEKKLYSSAKLVDVALATSAFPPIFPIVGRVGPGGTYHGYLDGYLSANSPVMSAVTLALRDLCEGDLSRLEVLSLGGVQSHEEGNLERMGGLTANLVLLFDKDRSARQTFWTRAMANLGGYLQTRSFRTQMKAEDIGFGAHEEGRWGWLDLAKRPTILGNMALHGATREIDRQCRRLLRGKYHRVALRMNVISSIFHILVGDWGYASGTFDRAARLALGKRAHHADAPSVDDEDNVKTVHHLETWIRKTLLKAPRRLPAARAPRRTSLAQGRAKASTT